MSGIILFINVELSGRIRYHLTTLHKNTTKTNPRCIKIKSLIVTTVRQNKHRGLSESVLEFLETLLTSLHPFKLDFLLRQSYEWCIHGRKTLNEPAIITSQSQEATDICGSKRFWPLLKSLSLPGIYLHTFFRHNMT